ncbi:pachytene checkpoint protein 2 homolog [Glandiceps talaboti]
MDQVGDIGNALPDPLELCIHVEVCQNPYSTLGKDIIKSHVTQLLHRHQESFGDVLITQFDDAVLNEHVKSVAIFDTDLNKPDRQVVDLCTAKLCLHVFQLQGEGSAAEEIDDDDDISAANHWVLPSEDFHGLWENLIFDSNVKGELLQYAETTLLFSDKKVDCNVISWNRVILLHGPPGTGKTSLSKALAQKLCIRLSDRYSYGQLIEINSHSLFSKWFSESGKLVMKMFKKIQDLIDNQDSLVCVLIDEVESLTSARKSALNGTEPSDAIRVVNALLTQIDQIKKHPNVIILTTSNVTGAIDLAFVDRADIKQFIGMPSPAAVFKIYHSCLNELMRTGIISPAQQLMDMRGLEVMRFIENDATRLSLKLREIAINSYGLSGRTLRKLPFLAHAMYLQSSSTTLEDFLLALSHVVKRQFQEREHLEEPK